MKRDRQTDKPTHGLRNSMKESAKGRLFENIKTIKKLRESKLAVLHGDFIFSLLLFSQFEVRILRVIVSKFLKLNDNKDPSLFQKSP